MKNVVLKFLIRHLTRLYAGVVTLLCLVILFVPLNVILKSNLFCVRQGVNYLLYAFLPAVVIFTVLSSIKIIRAIIEKKWVLVLLTSGAFAILGYAGYVIFMVVVWGCGNWG